MKVPPNTHEYCSRTNPQKISCQNDTRLYDKGTKGLMTHRPLIYRLSMLLSALFLSAGFMTASPPVVMKLLILAWDGNDGSYQSIARDLGQIGVPYDTVFVNNLTPDGSGNRLSGITLVDSANARGLYQGIVE